MTIGPNGQTSVLDRIGRAEVGMIEAGDPDIRSVLVGARGQITTVDITPPDDGESPPEDDWTGTWTWVIDGVEASSTTITSHADLRTLLGTLAATFGFTTSLAGSVITINFVGGPHTVNLTGPVGSTIVVATVQAATGDRIKIGRLLLLAEPPDSAEGVDRARELVSGDDATILERAWGGVVMRIVGYGRPDEPTPDALPRDSSLPVVRRGVIYVRNEGGAVASTGAVFAVKTAGALLGGFRGTADGGNTIAIPTNRARWLDTPAPGAIGRLEIRMG